MSAANQQAKERQTEALRRALGSEILHYLDDPKVIEILLNPDGKVWVDILSEGMKYVSDMGPIQSKQIVSTVAAMLDTVVTPKSPILECELPLDGSRFEALIPPLVAQPTFSLRKKALLIFTLEDYVAKGIMSESQKFLIEQAARDRSNILVIGGTGTGKTTLANAIIDTVAKLNSDHRIVVIEDTRELQVSAPNTVFLRTSDNADMTCLLRATMRLRPDRIIVGEVRDGSALALLKAWNTGHPGGVGTVHANDARAALIRIGQLISEVTPQPQADLIAQAVNLVVSIKRTPVGRVVEEVLRVNGWSQEGGFDVLNLA